jgi:hypothetical protein
LRRSGKKNTPAHPSASTKKRKNAPAPKEQAAKSGKMLLLRKSKHQKMEKRPCYGRASKKKEKLAPALNEQPKK